MSSKKILALLLAAAFILLTLTGCGNGGGKDSSETPSKTPSEPTQRNSVKDRIPEQRRKTTG